MPKNDFVPTLALIGIDKRHHETAPTIYNTSYMIPAQRSSSPGPNADFRRSAFVTSLTANDVLMGRGASVDNAEGNKRFRELVRQHKNQYISTSRLKKKHEIATEVMEILAARGGSFLRKIDDPAEARDLGVPADTTNAWTYVSEDVAMKKVKQALRGSGISFSEDGESAAVSTSGATGEQLAPANAQSSDTSALNFDTNVLSNYLRGQMQIVASQGNPSLAIGRSFVNEVSESSRMPATNVPIPYSAFLGLPNQQLNQTERLRPIPQNLLDFSGQMALQYSPLRAQRQFLPLLSPAQIATLTTSINNSNEMLDVIQHSQLERVRGLLSASTSFSGITENQNTTRSTPLAQLSAVLANRQQSGLEMMNLHSSELLSRQRLIDSFVTNNQHSLRQYLSHRNTSNTLDQTISLPDDERMANIINAQFDRNASSALALQGEETSRLFASRPTGDPQLLNLLTSQVVESQRDVQQDRAARKRRASHSDSSSTASDQQKSRKYAKAGKKSSR